MSSSRYDEGTLEWCVSRMKFQYNSHRGRWTDDAADIFWDEFARIGERTRIRVVNELLGVDDLPTLAGIRRIVANLSPAESDRRPYEPPIEYCPPERGVPMAIAAFERQWRADHNGQPPDPSDPWMMMLKGMRNAPEWAKRTVPDADDPFA